MADKRQHLNRRGGRRDEDRPGKLLHNLVIAVHSSDLRRERHVDRLWRRDWLPVEVIDSRRTKTRQRYVHCSIASDGVNAESRRLGAAPLRVEGKLNATLSPCRQVAFAGIVYD